MNLLIKNGHIIDPANKVDGKLDLLVSDGKIAKIGKPGSLSLNGAEVVDAAGLLVVPGLIDMHVHLDALPQFAGKQTTTEFLSRHIFDAMAQAARTGALGPGGEGISKIRVTLHESHVARAWFEGLRDRICAEIETLAGGRKKLIGMVAFLTASARSGRRTTDQYGRA